jgi:hypothetical protein
MKLLILTLTFPVAFAFHAATHIPRRNSDTLFSPSQSIVYNRGQVPSSSLFLLGNLFGGSNDQSMKEDGELALYPNLATSKTNAGDVKFKGLSDYIQKWSNLFETDPKGMGLTTPIQLLPSMADPDGEMVVACSGVRLVFKSIDTGYKSKTEEGSDQNTNQNTNQDKKKKKGKEKKQGGVEVLVEKLSSGEVRVRAKRCDLDEDTMIKEMSEESIINELGRAIDVWKKEK